MTRKQIADIIWSRFDQGNEDWIKCDVAAGWILAALDDEERAQSRCEAGLVEKWTKAFCENYVETSGIFMGGPITSHETLVAFLRAGIKEQNRRFL